MKFPDHLKALSISEGDIVNLIFEGVELTMRLANVPDFTDLFDRVCPIRDFRNLDYSDWDEEIEGGALYKDFAFQSWYYYDEKYRGSIADCVFKISIIKSRPSDVESLFSLNSQKFKSQVLNWLKLENAECEPETRINWPCADNDYFAESLKLGLVDGLLTQDQFDQEEDRIANPDLDAFIPLGQFYYMVVKISFKSIHIETRKNPYTEDQIHQMKIALMKEFVSCINIEYDEETTALIKKLKEEEGQTS